MSAQTGDLSIQNVPKSQTLARVKRLSGPAYTSAPTSAMTVSGIDRRHWSQITAGWLVRSSRPLTSAQIAEARRIAVLAGLTIETRDPQASLGAIRLGAAVAGVLLALGVLALTVGLIRNEGASDLRNLVAAGATARLRRMLTAATAGGLALLGVVLGLLSAYLGLARGTAVPWEALVTRRSPTWLTVALSYRSCVHGWLAACRTRPSHVARSVTD